MIQSFILIVLTDRRGFFHVVRLREDPTIPEPLGVGAAVGDNTVLRFFKLVDPVLGLAGEGIVRQAAQPLWDALPVQTISGGGLSIRPKYGDQNADECRYSSATPGRRSFHPVLATAVVPSILFPPW